MKNRRIRILVRVVFGITLLIALCAYIQRVPLLNSIRLIHQGRKAPTAYERQSLVMFALEELPEKPIFAWALCPFEGSSDASLQIRTDALRYSLTGRPSQLYDNLRLVASTPASTPEDRRRMTAIAALGYVTRRKEDTARFFGEMLRSGGLKDEEEGSLHEMLYVKESELGYHSLRSLLPDYDSLMGYDKMRQNKVSEDIDASAPNPQH